MPGCGSKQDVLVLTTLQYMFYLNDHQPTYFQISNHTLLKYVQYCDN